MGLPVLWGMSWKKRIMRRRRVYWCIIDLWGSNWIFSVLFIPSYTCWAMGPLWLLGFFQVLVQSGQFRLCVWLLQLPWIGQCCVSLSTTNFEFSFFLGDMKTCPPFLWQELNILAGREHPFSALCDTDLAIYQCENIFVCLYAQLLQSCPAFCYPLQMPSSTIHGSHPGKNTEWFRYFLLQGIYLTPT